MTKEEIREVKNKAAILDYFISKGIEVRGYKKSFSCPFHQDNNPSAIIYDNSDHDYFRCYACPVRGDIIEMVSRMEGIEKFYDIIDFIRERYGL